MDAIERLQVRWVVFTGGEPLMHSNLFALADLLRGRGIRVTILSTGLLFERFAREITEHVDDAIVSLGWSGGDSRSHPEGPPRIQSHR